MKDKIVEKRVPGIYRVKFGSSYDIAEYTDRVTWFRIGHSSIYLDSDFLEIGNKPIELDTEKEAKKRIDFGNQCRKEGFEAARETEKGGMIFISKPKYLDYTAYSKENPIK